MQKKPRSNVMCDVVCDGEPSLVYTRLPMHFLPQNWGWLEGGVGVPHKG